MGHNLSGEVVAYCLNTLDFLKWDCEELIAAVIFPLMRILQKAFLIYFFNSAMIFFSSSDKVLEKLMAVRGGLSIIDM